MSIITQKIMSCVKEHRKLRRSFYLSVGAIAITLITSLSMSGCKLDWCGFKSYAEKGTWQEFQGIFTVVEPADLALYRELLPAELDMPEVPAVGVFIVDYQVVVPCPMRPYLEGALGIKGVYKGEEGWHTVTMPLDLNSARLGGLGVGFPKYMAEVTLTGSDENLPEDDNEEAGSYEGIVTDEGVVRMSLDFTPGLTRPLTPFEEDVLASGLPRLEGIGFQKGPISSTGDPSEYGPSLYRITLVDKVQANWESVLGMAKIHISPDDPWAGLIAPDADAVGLFQVFSGGKIMEVEKLEVETIETE